MYIDDLGEVAEKLDEIIHIEDFTLQNSTFLSVFKVHYEIFRFVVDEDVDTFSVIVPIKKENYVKRPTGEPNDLNFISQEAYDYDFIQSGREVEDLRYISSEKCYIETDEFYLADYKKGEEEKLVDDILRALFSKINKVDLFGGLKEGLDW